MALNQKTKVTAIGFTQEPLEISGVVTKESLSNGEVSLEITNHIGQTGRLYYKNNESSKMETEFSRYKQDCRKRALDLAEKTVGESRKNGTFDIGMKDESGKIIPKEVAEEMLLIGLADKYYNWLISIPETK